jgi:hypothetical protein
MPEMRRTPRRHHADAELARHGDGLLHGPRADHEAEAVVAVEGRGHRRHAIGFEIGFGIDQAGAHALQIDRQPAKAVGVDAAQVGADETAGDGGGIFRRHAMGLEQRAGEGVGRHRAGIDEARCGLSSDHQSLMSLICFARVVAAPSRKAKSVPVET